MKKNFLTREVKVGIMAVIALFVLYFGMNFLKGSNIFSSQNYYYARYENLGGLLVSSPVYIKGYKVGQVEKISYDFTQSNSFVVKISVSKDIQLPKGAIVQLYDEGLMGGKAIQIVYQPLKATASLYSANDTIPSEINTGMMAKVAGQMLPEIQNVASQADSLLRSVRVLIENKDLTRSLSSIEKTTSNLASSSAQLKGMMHKDIPQILGNVNTVTSDFKQISGNIKKIDFAATFTSINYTISNLNLLTDKMKSKDGTIGLLLNDKDLYYNLVGMATDADKLLVDLKANPKRYVHFSVFSSKSK